MDSSDDLSQLDDLQDALKPDAAAPVDPLTHGDIIDEVLGGGSVLFVVPSEDVAQAFNAWGAPATCSRGGIARWNDACAARLRDGDIVLALSESDALRVTKSLTGVAKRVRQLRLPPSALNGGVNDFIAERGGVEAIYDMASRAPQAGFQSKFKARLWRDLGKPTEPYDWLVKPLIARGEVSVVAGPSGSGKSFLITDLALSIARGKPFMGVHRVKPGGVIYQAGEGKKGLLTKRLPAYMQWHGLRWDDDLPFAVLPAELDLFHGDDMTTAFIAECKALAMMMDQPLELIVIDTLAAAISGADENSSKDVGPVITRCNRIQQETGAAVILVHHMNADGSKIRGWTGWQANVDGVLICTKQEDMHDGQGRMVRELRIGKAKEGDDNFKLRYVLGVVTIGEDEDGDPLTSCVIEEPEGKGGGVAQRNTVRLTDREREFLEAVEWCLGEYGTSAGEAGLKIAKTVPVVKHGYVKQRFAEKTFAIDPDDSDKVQNNRIDQAIKRAGASLVKLGLIDREGKYYWRTDKRLTEWVVEDDAKTASDNAKSDTASDGASAGPATDPDDEAPLW